MKRTTIYLDPDLNVLLKLEAIRQKRPSAEIIRDALRAYLKKNPRGLPPGIGAYNSGHTDTSERIDELKDELGFPDNR